MFSPGDRGDISTAISPPLNELPLTDGGLTLNFSHRKDCSEMSAVAGRRASPKSCLHLNGMDPQPGLLQGQPLRRRDRAGHHLPFWDFCWCCPTVMWCVGMFVAPSSPPFSLQALADICSRRLVFCGAELGFCYGHPQTSASLPAAACWPQWKNNEQPLQEKK